MRFSTPSSIHPSIVIKFCTVIDIVSIERKRSKTVAFSAWQYPYTLTEEQKKEKEARDKKRQDEPPEGSNDALIKDFFTKLFAGRKKWIVPEKTFCEWSQPLFFNL